MGKRHIQQPHSRGKCEPTCYVPSLLNIGGVDRVVDIFTNTAASLGEGGCVAQQVIGDGSTRECSVETGISGGIGAGGPLPLGAEKQRDTSFQKMLTMHPAPV